MDVKVSKRFAERAKGNLRRYQKIFEAARTRDVNESDTCVMISDFLADVLGYDKYSEVTTEFAIRSTFCDLAIKVAGRVAFLIEVKSIGTDLRENHVRQALDYAANQGIEWVLLTNGATWHAYRLRFEQPIRGDMVFVVDLLDPNVKPSHLIERLYLISREAASGSEIAEYYQRKEATSRYVLAQLMLAAPTLGILRRQLRQRFPGLRVAEDAIAELLRAEVIKRDALEGEKATAAERMIKRGSRRMAKQKGVAPVPDHATSPGVNPTPEATTAV